MQKDTRFEFDVVVDLGAGDIAPPFDSPRREWLLVHPQDAIQWIATGKFTTGPEDPVLPWWRLAMDTGSEYYEETGRQELAEELLTHAIATGRVRLAQVDNMGTSDGWRREVPRLLVLDPAKLAGLTVSFDQDDGLKLFINLPPREEDSEDDWTEIEEFFLLWDEVAQLRPDRRHEQQSGPSPQHSWVGTTVPSSHGLPIARGIVPQSQSQKGRRGRKPRHYGAPIAQFLARAVREGLEQAAREKDETLGYWLLDEYAARGDTNPPDIRNAASDARGALTAWIAATAQKEKD